MDRYVLEIYAPLDQKIVIGSLYSDTPFGAIAKGDLVNVSALGGSEHGFGSLRVVGIEHFLSEAKGEPHHVVAVYTEHNLR